MSSIQKTADKSFWYFWLMMGFILGFIVSSEVPEARAAEYDIRFVQRNSTDTGDVMRIPAHPLTPGLLSFDPEALLPVWVTLGSGLTINSGVLAIQSSYMPVNADWNATSGLAQVLNKPTIPASQVNSDWNSASGLSQILNKPSIPAAQVNADWVSNSGVSQILNRPTIPAAQVNSDWSAVTGVAAILNKPSITPQVNSDWSASSGVAQILNKPTIPAAQVSSDWNSSSGVSQILNKPSIPAAQVNSDWNASSGVSAILNKPTIPGSFNFGAPVSRTITLANSFQASNPAKAAVITVSPSCTSTLTLTGGVVCEYIAKVGDSSLSCQTGTEVGHWINGNSGDIVIGVSLVQTIGAPATINLPAGGYAIMCLIRGTGFQFLKVVDQTAG